MRPPGGGKPRPYLRIPSFCGARAPRVLVSFLCGARMRLGCSFHSAVSSLKFVAALMVGIGDTKPVNARCIEERFMIAIQFEGTSFAVPFGQLVGQASSP